MFAKNRQPSGFDRWKKNVKPTGTLEEYELFLATNRKGKIILPPAVVPLPNGCLVSAVNLSYAEICSLNQEHVKQGFGQQ